MKRSIVWIGIFGASCGLDQQNAHRQAGRARCRHLRFHWPFESLLALRTPSSCRDGSVACGTK